MYGQPSTLRVALKAGAKAFVSVVGETAVRHAEQPVMRIFSKKSASEIARIADSATSINQLRQKLGRTGLLDLGKVTIVRVPPAEAPSFAGIVIYGWIALRGGRLVTDARRRPIIYLTDHALASLRIAVETVGHELHHIAEVQAGAGASEKAAEEAGQAFWQRFLQRLR